MAVMTFKSDDYKALPPLIKDFASYTANIKGNSEKTVCEYLLDIRTFFRFVKCIDSSDTLSKEEFEKISIADLSEEDIRAVTPRTIVEFLMFARTERENMVSTRMRKLSALRSFFKYMHTRRHIIDTDPTDDIDPPKKGRALPKYLSVEEAVRLLETVRSDNLSKTVDRDYAIITLFLNTGMRLSELVGLNLQSLDSHLDFVRVVGKGDKERTVYLNHAAKSALTTYLKMRLDPKYISTSDNALFLSTRQQRISNKTVQWIIYKYLDLAGLGEKGLSVHKLRHTAATLMYQSGKVDIRVLKDILGHEQLNTTQIYTHVVSQNMESAMKNNPLSDVVIKKTRETDPDRR